MLDFLNAVDSVVWGPPLLILLVGTGIILTIKLHLIQVLRLPLALKLIFHAENQGEGDVNSFKALCTALAATVGTGNIVGVATAIKAGGPGALFWMWVAAFFGMATKYAECLLAVKYRTVDKNGAISGGPMYYIENGLGPKYRPLAKAFALFGVIAACFGIGTYAQTNSITDIINITTGVSPVTAGFVVTLLVAVITFNGLDSISKASSTIVPVMAIVYFMSTVAILAMNIEVLPGVIATVLESAFTPTAAQGGFLGATVMLAMRSGVARGVFSNESGLGSAPIVAAAATTNYPAEQGLVSMTGTFIDTIIICTLTGLTLITTGVWCGPLNGAAMTAQAFSIGLNAPVGGPILLMIGLSLFAFTTILGWNYYGERCMEYLGGVKMIKPYRIFFVCIIATSPFLKLEEIWALADIVNGLMAIPNLIALLLLMGPVVYETRNYMEYLESKKAKEAK